MADAVSSNVFLNSIHDYRIHLTNISDGTGETAVVKVDKSTLTAPDGAEPNSLDLVTARWAIYGFASVRLFWDHNADDPIMILTGSGFEDFRSDTEDGTHGTNSLPDPRSAGGAGDVLLTTNGSASGNTYDITLWFKKRAN